MKILYLMTEPFGIGGVQSDVLTLTTYNVPGGNMRTAPMGEGEF